MTSSKDTGENDRLKQQRASSSIVTENDPLLAGRHTEKTTKASPWHIIGPLFLFTFGIGALMAPMVQFYTEIFCNRYYQSKVDTEYRLITWLLEGDRDDVPLPDIKDCNIPEIQAIVSRVQGICMFLTAATSLLVAGYYGSLSDRHGRRVVLQIVAIGSILTLLCYIAVAKHQDTVGVTLLILAPLLRGLLGNESISLAVVQAYISDCTSPEERTVAFGRMMASILIGGIIGPMTASFIIAETGSLLYVFYLVLLINVGFYIYFAFLIPESLSQESMEAAKQHASEQRPSLLQRLNFFSSLSIIFKAEPHHISRYALPIISLIQFLVGLILQPPVLLYGMLEFNWTAYEGGLMISITSSVRFFTVVVVMPRLVRYLNRRWHEESISLQQQQQDEPYGNDQNFQLQLEEDNKVHHRIQFDSWMIRSGLAIETVCWMLAALASTPLGFASAIVLHSISILAQPSLKSLSTTLVEPSQLGALLAAQAVLDAAASMLSQTSINFIYSISVGTMPNLFLYLCAIIAAVSCLLSFLVYPVKHQNGHLTP